MTARSQPGSDLLEAARTARGNAHAPHSKFRVGASVRAADGRIFAGANIESTSYGLTLCAERGAIAAAVTAGAVGGDHPKLTEVVIIAEGPRPVPPCGACRQVISELVASGSKVWLVEARSGEVVARTPEGLLPDAFDDSFLAPTHASDDTTAD